MVFPTKNGSVSFTLQQYGCSILAHLICYTILLAC